MGRRLGGTDVRHGMSRTRIYKLWVAMMNRCGHYKCSNPAALKYYVSRGVVVCDEWRTFVPFKDWALANGYDEGLTLDRISSAGDYTPSNCQWISMTENLRKRSGVRLNMDSARAIRARHASGESMSSLANEFGVLPAQISRVCSGKRWAEAAA
jgi:hypothetical protein